MSLPQKPSEWLGIALRRWLGHRHAAEHDGAGLPLPLWDAAFDQGLVSFTDNGTALASPLLGVIAREALGVETAPTLLGLRDAHRTNLAVHRARHGF